MNDNADDRRVSLHTKLIQRGYCHDDITKYFAVRFEQKSLHIHAMFYIDAVNVSTYSAFHYLRDGHSYPM